MEVLSLYWLVFRVWVSVIDKSHLQVMGNEMQPSGPGLFSICAETEDGRQDLWLKFNLVLACWPRIYPFLEW